jgi:hypothetical protein
VPALLLPQVIPSLLPGTAVHSVVAAAAHSLLSMTLLVVNMAEGSAAASSSGDSCSAVLGVMGRGAPAADRWPGACMSTTAVRGRDCTS